MTWPLRNSGAASQCVAVCCSVLHYTVVYCSYVASDSMQPLCNSGAVCESVAVCYSAPACI